MKYFILIVSFLLSFSVLAGFTDADKAQMNLENQAQNGGAEQGKTHWNNSGGTMTVDTAVKLTGKASIKFASNSASDYIYTDAVAIKHGPNCDINFWYKATVATTAYVMQSTNIVVSLAIPANTVFQQADIPFVCADSSTTYFLKVMGAVGQTAFNIDDLFQGKNLGIGIANGAQYSWSGYFDTAASWSLTSTSYIDFTASGTPNLTQRTNNGFGTVAKADSSLPGIKFTPPSVGQYVVCMSPAIYVGNVTTTNSIQMTDGTNVISTIFSYQSSTNNLVNNLICGIINITSSSSVTIKLQGKAASGLIGIDSSGHNAIEISIYSLNTTSQQVITPNTSAAYWSGYFDTAASWSTTSPSFADPTVSGTPNLVQLQANNLTVAKADSSLPGIKFTPPHVGAYFICMDFTLYGSAANQNAVARMTDGTNVITSSAKTVTANGAIYAPATLCGIENISSIASPTTVKIQLYDDSGTAAIFSASTRTIDISVIDITHNFPMSQIVNSVYSQFSGQTRIIYGKVSSTGTITTSGSGDWTATHIGTGNYSISFSPAWSGINYICNYTASTKSNIAIDQHNVGVNTSSTAYYFVGDLSGSSVDSPVSFNCIGNK